ncbi:hypothetical protein HMPREF9318_01578 [Streptococcus urinalis FB127-CNA-2]|uniref:Uncharacterized protein n=1 Tax=Streptococcus urinalis 2285-97 TaxID=764291 RepID=G5KFK3_9STRE|nr:hypothetical protein [Streptococcus urinalis]QBX12173.1 hypothetical protein JavanS644_0009 [Streptococcus satellite phage Javan644]QBX12201.1 hypothetical protein JavanS647_0009 [Streptococcus satellite phage Javan647]QBX12210.1 hypothetical protein JavanS649_0005 [Streptococcus satellite phage Javan649]EHJ56435.1 hypothetical protein STRUR_2270 [Streptococcus urinalis 2285-97]EKS19182.1 hypothetical protein HMPREF9318_01578 [Streptococcus urinalis FB127-CNA-2]
MRNEVFDVRDYLVQNNYPQSLIDLLDDVFTHNLVSKEEQDKIMAMPTEEINEFVLNYKRRSPKRQLTFREAINHD